jgi:hypothetical protein
VSVGAIASKTYLVLLAFANSVAILGILGVNEPIFTNPLGFWSWNLVSVAIFLILPILIVARDSYVLYLILSGVYLFRILLESFAFIMWTSSLNLIYISLYSLAVLICLGFAANKVSFEIAGKILSLSWSQF